MNPEESQTRKQFGVVRLLAVFVLMVLMVFTLIRQLLGYGYMVDKVGTLETLTVSSLFVAFLFTTKLPTTEENLKGKASFTSAFWLLGATLFTYSESFVGIGVCALFGVSIYLIAKKLPKE